MSINQIHYVIRPAYVGLTMLIFSLILILFVPESTWFVDYEYTNFAYVFISGAGIAIWTGAINLAFKNLKISRIAWIFSLENLFTLLCDIYIFELSLWFTDIVGAVIIMCSILIPIFKFRMSKIMTKKYKNNYLSINDSE